MTTPAAVTALIESKVLPLAVLVDSPFNPRKFYDPVYIEELAASMRGGIGIQQPLKVRPKPGQPDVYEIIFGHCRKRGGLKAGIVETLCLIEDMDDLKVREVQLIENIQRKDVSPMEQAQGFRDLLDMPPVDGAPPHTVESIAARIGGKSRVSYVYSQLKLLALGKDARAALDKGEISASQGVLLARLPETLQSNALGSYGIKSHDGMPASVRDLKQWIAANGFQDLREACFDKTNANLPNMKAAGACITCPKYSAVNAQLRDEVDGDVNTCTDVVCYKKKTWAHLDQQFDALVKDQAELGKLGIPVVRIIRGYMYDSIKQEIGKRVVLDQDDYLRAVPKDGTTCGNLRLGLIVHGADKGKAIQICAKKSCTVHNKSKATPSGKENAAAAQKRLEERRAKDDQEKRLAEEIRRKITFDDRLLRLAVIPLLQTVEFDKRADLAKAFGLSSDMSIKSLTKDALAIFWTKPITDVRAILLEVILYGEPVDLEGFESEENLIRWTAAQLRIADPATPSQTSAKPGDVAIGNKGAFGSAKSKAILTAAVASVRAGKLHPKLAKGKIPAAIVKTAKAIKLDPKLAKGKKAPIRSNGKIAAKITAKAKKAL